VPPTKTIRPVVDQVQNLIDACLKFKEKYSAGVGQDDSSAESEHFSSFVKAKLSQIDMWAVTPADQPYLVKMLFDFVDIEDLHPDLAAEPEIKVMQWLDERSLSFRETDFEQPIATCNKRKLEAHTTCRKFVQQLQEYTDQNYLDFVSNDRPKVVEIFIDQLVAMNKGPLLNGMDETIFSLNLEYSVEQNFKIYAALKLYLKSLEFQSRYELVQLLQSPHFKNEMVEGWLEYA